MSDESRLSSRSTPLALTWARDWLAVPPPRPRAALIVAAVLAAIGWIDYVAGFWVSLQLFYLLPIVLAVAWLGWSAGCLTAILGVALRLIGDMAANIFSHVDALAVFWNRLAELGISLLVVSVLHALFSLQRELEERVRQRTASLEQALAARDQLQNQLFEAGNRERGAIGHDLHDGLGQHLAATAMAANLLATRLTASRQPTAADAAAIVRLLQEAIAKTRQLARGLLLSAIEPEELAAELEELAETLRREHRVACTFTLRGTLRSVNVAASSHLFYIAQEAARNAVRHAGGSRVDLDLSVDDRALTLSITDNGSGLVPAADAKPGMGLRIMRHRSELIGAAFSLHQPPAGGTVVTCQLPLPAPVAALNVA